MRNRLFDRLRPGPSGGESSDQNDSSDTSPTTQQGAEPEPEPNGPSGPTQGRNPGDSATAPASGGGSSDSDTSTDTSGASSSDTSSEDPTGGDPSRIGQNPGFERPDDGGGASSDDSNNTNTERRDDTPERERRDTDQSRDRDQNTSTGGDTERRDDTPERERRDNDQSRDRDRSRDQDTSTGGSARRESTSGSAGTDDDGTTGSDPEPFRGLDPFEQARDAARDLGITQDDAFSIQEQSDGGVEISVDGATATLDDEDVTGNDATVEGAFEETLREDLPLSFNDAPGDAVPEPPESVDESVDEQTEIEAVADQTGIGTERDGSVRSTGDNVFVADPEGPGNAEVITTGETDQDAVAEAELEAALDRENVGEGDLMLSDGEVVPTDSELRERAATDAEGFDAGDFTISSGGGDREVVATDSALREQAAAETDQFTAEDFTVEGEPGEREVIATDSALRERAAADSEQFTAEDFTVEGQPGEGREVGLGPEAVADLRESLRRDVAGESPVVSPDDVSVKRTENGGFRAEVETVSGEDVPQQFRGELLETETTVERDELATGQTDVSGLFGDPAGRPGLGGREGGDARLRSEAGPNIEGGDVALARAAAEQDDSERFGDFNLTGATAAGLDATAQTAGEVVEAVTGENPVGNARPFRDAAEDGRDPVEDALDETTETVASEIDEVSDEGSDQIRGDGSAPPGVVAGAGVSAFAADAAESTGDAIAGVARAPSDAVEAAETAAFLGGPVLSGDSDRAQERREQFTSTAEDVIDQKVTEAQRNPVETGVDVATGAAVGAIGGVGASRVLPRTATSRTTAARSSVAQVRDAIPQPSTRGVIGGRARRDAAAGDADTPAADDAEINAGVDLSVDARSVVERLRDDTRRDRDRGQFTPADILPSEARSRTDSDTRTDTETDTGTTQTQTGGGDAAATIDLDALDDEVAVDLDADGPADPVDADGAVLDARALRGDDAGETTTAAASRRPDGGEPFRDRVDQSRDTDTDAFLGETARDSVAGGVVGGIAVAGDTAVETPLGTGANTAAESDTDAGVRAGADADASVDTEPAIATDGDVLTDTDVATELSAETEPLDDTSPDVDVETDVAVETDQSPLTDTFGDTDTTGRARGDTDSRRDTDTTGRARGDTDSRRDTDTRRDLNRRGLRNDDDDEPPESSEDRSADERAQFALTGESEQEFQFEGFDDDLFGGDAR